MTVKRRDCQDCHRPMEWFARYLHLYTCGRCARAQVRQLRRPLTFEDVLER